jgi:1-acyl-sn-glycerol-3-phosphate acyltransferase
VVAHAIVPRRTLFSALESTVRATPFLGNFIRFLGAFPIPERLSLVRLVRPVREALARGWLVHFFPERDLKYQNRALQPFHPGVFFLAQLCGVPVVPVTLASRHPRLLGRRVARAYVRVTAVIGEPIDPARFFLPGVPRREALARMASHTRQVMQRTLWQYGDAQADGLADVRPAEGLA